MPDIFSDVLEECPKVGEGCTKTDLPCVTCHTICRRDYKFSKAVQNHRPMLTGLHSGGIKPHSSPWLDEHTFTCPLSPLQKNLMLMLLNNVALKRYDHKSRAEAKIKRSKTPSIGLGTTPVPNMTGVRLWVTNAADILSSTCMEEEEYPDDPKKTNNYQHTVTTVYVRFRIEGKLQDAGAGYWLAPSLSHLVTSIYVGLSFKSLLQSDVVDIGVIRGTRTVVAFPCCYSAMVDPVNLTWTCKKGNIDNAAKPVTSFRLGDVGVGHPEWVEATKSDGGMNALSMGTDVAHNRLLVIMTELLTTRILEVINTIPNDPLF